MESAKKFIAQIQNDETLQSKLSTLLATGDKESFVAFMKSNGVTDQGVAELIDQEEFVSTTTGELSDKALEAVSGGGFNWCNGIKNLIDSF